MAVERVSNHAGDRASSARLRMKNAAPQRRQRIVAALLIFVNESEKRGMGICRKATVGFCFGGGHVLELARASSDVQAVTWPHADLTSLAPAKPGDIKVAPLVVQGAADPVSSKAQRTAFESGMQAANASWRMVTFGHLVHSF